MRTTTLADVFVLFGVSRQDVVRHAADNWRQTINRIRPDLVIADFAPILRLAIGDDVPSVVVGNGYTIPPKGKLLPPMRPWRDTVEAMSRFHEASLLAAVNAYRIHAGSPAIDFFADLFHGTITHICSAPEFDPYGRCRTEPLVTPFNIPNVSAGPPVASREDYGIFAYVPSDHPALEAVVQVLESISEPSELYVGEHAPSFLTDRRPSNMRLRLKPVDYAAVLPRTKLLLHHGGLGTTYAGLLAGAPQLILPLSLEHLITGRQAEKLGPAIVVSLPEQNNGARAVEQLHLSIGQLYADPKVHSAAARVALSLANRDREGGLQEVADSCHRLLA